MAKKYQVDEHTQMIDPVMVIQRLVVNYPGGTTKVDVSIFPYFLTIWYNNGVN